MGPHVVAQGLPTAEDEQMRQAGYVRLFADDHGESHFEEVEVALEPVDFAPPAPPLHVASLFPTSQSSFVSGPPDWGGHVPHPSPRRQLLCNLRGEYTSLPVMAWSVVSLLAAFSSSKIRLARGIQRVL